ncbi:uncharacterized protein LOC126195287 [Schistocerca nitens]|uniref:uncharacterized protein LOC126195287 n=1 Tax=Schistocerca nitens TaxID=7011 RepID=UPI00211869FC|nr:uncharacterized protein LOC126195287 [Schistocerca nitens]
MGPRPRPVLLAAALVVVLAVLRGRIVAEAELDVRLAAPRHVLFGHSALFRCEYSVPRELLHKVEWLRNGRKMFQFVRGRSPPFREFHVLFAKIDRNESDERQLMLRGLKFEASGIYTCEVSTIAPIFTRSSEEAEVIVIQPQRWPPLVSVGRPVYTAGETLRANCTTSPARPAPSVVWLLNGHKIPGSHYQQTEHRDPDSEHLSWSTSKLKMHLTDAHVGTMTLTCVAAVPGFAGEPMIDFIDQREHSATAEVVVPVPESSACRGNPPIVSQLLLPLLLCGALL